MVDESSVAAGKRFSRDMRLIREERETSLDAVHKETRIARSLIESFERGGLYDHPTFNEVYLRSFVQAYAETVGIPPEVALDELDAALQGTYESALADRYLQSSPGEEVAGSADEEEPEASEGAPSGEDAAASESEAGNSQSAPPTAGGPEGRGGIVGPPRALDETADAGDEKAQLPSSEETPSAEEASEPRAAPSSPSSTPEADSEETTAPEAETNVQEEEPGDGSAEEGVDDESGEGATLDDETGPASDAPAETPASMNGADADAPDDESEKTPDVPAGRPTWMDDADEETDPPSTSAGGGGAPEAVGTGREDDALPDEGLDETGIVGEPTAVGEEEGPAEAARPGTATAPSRGSQSRSGWLQFLRDDRREMVWAGIGIVIILLVLVGLGVAYLSNRTEPAQDEPKNESQTTTPEEPDTAAAPLDDTTTASRPPPANVTLEDTIHLTVRAAAPVTGIRIQRDEDLERPYWIEEGEAAVFPFQRRIALEEELANIEVFLAGYPYRGGRPDTTGPDTTRQIVITRTQAEAFVDTLRGAPPTLDATPDTIPKGTPDQVDQ